jgi:peptidoglycan hydrolase-like protein with peptidoglycan-binding domain
LLIWALAFSAAILFTLWAWRTIRPSHPFLAYSAPTESESGADSDGGWFQWFWSGSDTGLSGAAPADGSEEFPIRAMELSLPNPISLAPPESAVFPPRPIENEFEMQLALVRHGCSPGSIDGVSGPQTRAALRAFQSKYNLPDTGRLDPLTRQHLMIDAPPWTAYTVTFDDLARLRTTSDTWLGKSQQDRLDYESVLELVAEKGMAYPNFVRRRNATLDWTTVTAGTELQIPYAYYPPIQRRAAFARIYLADRVLQAFDIETNLLVHFPCSIGRRVEKRPAGRLEVAVIAENPNYTFNPEIFSESPEGQALGRKLVVPPGPNNPVGVAWIGLNEPGYGIHGTPEPEQVGRTESHGCFRLANWSAEYFLKLVWVTMPVYVEP